MTGEEKFQVDLEGYLIIKNVLTADEVAEMNDITDNTERQGPPSLWGEPFKRLIDHPKILPYLLDLLGPNVRLDHDYAIFMNGSERRGGLHGGEDGGRPGGPEGDHWYKYRDGIMRNGLCVMTFNLADAPAGAGGFACIPGSHKSNFLREIPSEVRRFERPAHYVAQPALKQEMYYSSLRHSFTGQCRGQPNTNAVLCSINTVLDTPHGRRTTTTSANTRG